MSKSEIALPNFPKKGVIRATIETELKQPYSTQLPKAKGKYLHDKEKSAEFSKLGAHGLQRIYDNATGKFWDVPHITATSRKAALVRQPIANKVLETVTKNGDRVALSTVLSLATGTEPTQRSNKDLKAEGKATAAPTNLTDENLWRAEHPVQSICGTFGKHSLVEFSNAFPTILDEKFVAYMLGTRMDPVHEWYGSLSEEDQTKYLTIKELCTAKSLLEAEIVSKAIEKNALEDGSESKIKLEKEIAKMNKEVEAMEKKMEGYDIALLMPIPPRHIIPQGLKFKSTWTLRAVDSITPLSMVLHGLNEFSRIPKLGGFQTSCGEVEEIHTVSLHDFSGDKAVITELFKLKLGGYDDFEELSMSDEGRKWFDAARADISWHDKV